MTGQTATARPRIVLVTGFMAAGKTAVGEALAARLACPFVDLDRLVTERTGRTPQVHIDEDGEAAFREVETRALREVLSEVREGADASESFTKPRLVVALGGGAWTLERNRALARDARALTVWLDAPFELCWRRIAAEGAGSRPLARERESARALHAARRGAYALAALRVEAGEDKSVEDLAAEIAAAAGCC